MTWHSFLIGLNFWSPIAAIYFAKVSGSYTLGMSIFSIAMVSSAVFELPTGIFSDLLGRKKTVIISGAFLTLAMIFYALGLNYWILVIGAICEGLARSFSSGNNEALLFESLDKSEKKAELEKWIGYIGLAEHWASGIAAITGGILATISFKLAMWFSIIPVFVGFVISWWYLDVDIKSKIETNILAHLKEAWGNFVKNKKLRLLSLSDIIGFGLGESAFQFTPIFVANIWPLWAIGVARMLANIGAAIGFGISGKLLKKFKAINVLMFEQIYSKVASLVAFVFPSVVSPLLLSSTSLLYGPSTVAQKSLTQKEFSDKQRATMGSLNSLGRSIFFGMAMVWLGWMADNYGTRGALIFGQIAGLVSVWLTWKLLKLIRTEK